MAQIEKRKNGSYRIRVFCGYSADGEKQKSQSMTWKPPRDGMTAKQLEKALNKAVFDFEEKCRSGQIINSEKFENFCETWFVNYAERTMKRSAVDLCREYTPRVYSKLGHLRLDRITPREIDSFIVWLQKQPRITEPTMTYNGKIKQYLKSEGLNQKQFAQKAGISEQTVKAIIDGKKIKAGNAQKIAKVIGKPCSELFTKHQNERLLTPKTIKNYVSFVSSVFDYAVHIKEIKENPCKNALIPRIPKKEMNMFSLYY